MQQNIQLPGPMTLVRHYCEAPNDDDTWASVHELADAFGARDSQINMVVQQHIYYGHEISVEQCVWPQCILGLFKSQAYRMASIQTYNLCIQYWTTRVWFCGLIQTIHSEDLRNHRGRGALFSQSSSSTDASTLYLDDIDAAVNLIMCIPFALGLLDSTPGTVCEFVFPDEIPHQELLLLPLRLVICLQISFGSWHRLEKRLGHGPSGILSSALDAGIGLDVGQVQHIKKWLLKIIIEMQNMWQIRPSVYEELEHKVEMMAGGTFDESVWAPWQYN
ncbi:hypothetical protein NA57DRAFT_73798 [Rhizodiscina lignyota]|uniref:Uncharacterized protein n=1 Tax=Rhizodiscina lignyota TaxID=1504668 RepID=A0A9P4IJ33_9PEZI|nr:hypothetical protein NA57DRAFT_73798 [Rhizodiscina lignyota]